jgi:TM2 domain-containing membrane protein YozV
MNKQKKALLYSGLGFPGIGQFMAKRYIRGGLFVAAVLVGLGMIMVEVVSQAQAIVDQMLASGQFYDFVTMYKKARLAAANIDSSEYYWGLGLVGAAWLASIVDLLYFSSESQSS